MKNTLLKVCFPLLKLATINCISHVYEVSHSPGLISIVRKYETKFFRLNDIFTIPIANFSLVFSIFDLESSKPL